MTDHWKRIRVAEHEAAHAVAARAMGLPVSWVDIDPGRDEGIDFMAAVKIPDEGIDRERDLFAICVAMAFPSQLPHEDEIGRYARLEARLAYEIAGKAGISSGAVYDRVIELWSECYEEIYTLAERLVKEGRVEFTPA